MHPHLAIRYLMNTSIQWQYIEQILYSAGNTLLVHNRLDEHILNTSTISRMIEFHFVSSFSQSLDLSQITMKHFSRNMRSKCNLYYKEYKSGFNLSTKKKYQENIFNNTANYRARTYDNIQLHHILFRFCIKN